MSLHFVMLDVEVVIDLYKQKPMLSYIYNTWYRNKFLAMKKLGVCIFILVSVLYPRHLSIVCMLPRGSTDTSSQTPLHKAV